ncbi:hypothetical protein [Streptomyces sp. 6N223]|uniref:hypothetical protein n=1 Tax=Streptomyces sp. 6N223 TaxID=3457412 RepID=UPI003FD6214B
MGMPVPGGTCMARRRVRPVVEDLPPQAARLAGERELGEHVATYRFGDGTVGKVLGGVGAFLFVPAGIGLPLGPYPTAVRVVGGMLLVVPVALFVLGRRIDRAVERGPRVHVFDGGLVTGGSREPFTVRPWSSVLALWGMERVTAPKNRWADADVHFLEIRSRSSGALLCTLPACESSDGITTLRVAESAGVLPPG